MADEDHDEGWRGKIRAAAIEPKQVAAREAAACHISNAFQDVGSKLHAIGHVVGSDRVAGLSPYGHGDDATVAVSLLLRIAAQLVSASCDLTTDGRHYAASALIRQMVELEYLAWAFDHDNSEAARWLRSTHSERLTFFTPAKLRKAAEGHFRSVDYGYHCELGGHPVPRSWVLLTGDEAMAQLMLSDCLGHAERLWGHVVGWCSRSHNGIIVKGFAEQMAAVIRLWKEADVTTRLPPSPDDFPRDW